MGSLDRWLVASRKAEVFDPDTLAELEEMGAQAGGGFEEVHRHVLVTAFNKERVEAMLQRRGYKVSSASDPEVQHPELHHHCEA